MKKLVLLVTGFLCAIATIITNNDVNVPQKPIVSKVPNEVHKPKMDAPEMHGIIERQLRTPRDKQKPEYEANYKLKELKKLRQNSAYARTKSIEFVERGPGNVAGRTRALVIDPTDATQNTWLAGTASGGIWKTTDAGQTWTNKSAALPNLSTNALAISPADPAVVYAGTGEGWIVEADGFGLFKSEDFGETWTSLTAESDIRTIRNVNRIIVDPANADIVLMAVQNGVWEDDLVSGIYKSTDGGATWSKNLELDRAIQDLDADPNDFNVQYASVNRIGVYKSTDGGDTWSLSNNGMSPEGRVELAVSPTNSSNVWASVVGTRSGSNADLYYSNDAGVTWQVLKEDNGGPNIDFLSQGFYDNIITAHPFDDEIVYVGGVDLWRFSLSERDSIENTILSIDTDGTEDFFATNAFNGNFRPGLDLGESPDSLFVSVEIRFGQGTQKAHRFTVGKKGAGVPKTGFTYEDYVEVPFQVWDIDNDRQLMASFRDQQEDGAWNLLEFNVGEDTTMDTREYLYINAVEYSEEPDANIAQNGGENLGHEYNQIYFFWPHLAEGGEFDPANLPESKISVIWGEATVGFKVTDNISDAYLAFDSLNTFTNDQFENFEGIHPDHHNLIPVITNEANQTFKWIATNDGGVYVSNSGTNPGEPDNDWTYAGFGLNTTQFYGADKAPGQNRYIGGMQDNSTFFVGAGDEASASTHWKFAFGGDGAEALWNNRDPNQMIGTRQFNSIVRSTDGGETWRTTTGVADAGSGNGPFRSRLSNNKTVPDRIFAVGASGVWKSNDFGDTWGSIEIDSLWGFANSMEVEVSTGDADVIWAGAALTEDERLFYSTDGGETFSHTNFYDGDELGDISGLGTHPINPGTAYALFSFAARPKILETKDFGNTWTDISGFTGANARIKLDESSRGFPDVATYALLVMPNDPDQIWVGTDIGIIESTDAGASWHALEANLPPVPVYGFKIQDSQVVVATYGRGIWTHDLEVEVGVTVAPNLAKVFISPNGNFNLEIGYQSVFDSTEIYIDDNLAGFFGANEVGTLQLFSENPGVNGKSDVHLISYKAGEAFAVPSKEYFLFETNDIDIGYSNDFNSGLETDFVGFGFDARTFTGFSNVALHSNHPYGTNNDYQFILRSPVIVQSENSLFSYRDVVVVETGEEGTVFGDDEFWDYVRIEATKDGYEWVGLIDGYDSSFDPEWDSLYTNGLDGNQQFYINHDLEIRDQFAAGDTLLFRLRLFSDPGATGWGWAIDDLVIQGEPTVTALEDYLISNSLSLYPNPVIDVAQIEYELAQPSHISMTILDVSGRTLRSYEYGLVSGKGALEFDRRGLEGGIYLAQINIAGNQLIKRFIVE
ncbi:MAG: T9SS type A sorting domain-containing protein [Cyclobacteriaceae bacterium]